MFPREDALVVALVSPDRFGFYRQYGKRALDTFLILLVSPVIFVLMLAITVLLLLEGGSAFYTQKRLGRDWREFTIFKFKTMCPDADLVLQRHLENDPEARAEWDATQKLMNDPRITRVGKFLRKTSLDEIPQFLNVLAGSMSLVGPRPMLSEQKRLYSGQGYASMRPGMTGLWQISARTGSTFDARSVHDDRYNRNVSLGVDLIIMIKTFSAVANCTGR